MKNIQSCLNLFGGVISKAPDIDHADNIHIDYKLGIVIAPSAMHSKDIIVKVLSDKTLSSDQLNNTSFYKSWKKVAAVTLEERLRDQCLHYFTTYGLMAIGLDSPDFVYVPTDEFATKAPENLRLRVIKGYQANDLINSCFSMLKSGIALQESTIQDIINVLHYCDYKITGEESIANREARIYFAHISQILPKNSDDLFRYLIYASTKQTLVIKNNDLIGAIKTSNYKLNLTEEQIIELAKSFHRYKPLWLGFKSDKDNRSIVNRISKLAKKYHVPQPVNILGSLTSKEFDPQTCYAAVKNANIFQLIRALNAIDYYSTDNINRYYRIRNGKSFAKVKETSLEPTTLLYNQQLLVDEIRSRVKNQKVYIPEYINYAFPVSEKMYTGNIPKNTQFVIPYPNRPTKNNGQHLLIGVYWKNEEEHSDLDLSAISLSGKVGWNSRWNTSENGLMYSGDMAQAYHGASEYLYCKKITDSYLINLNAYNAPENQSYTLIIGYGDEIGHNYMIDPNKIIFSVDCVMDQKQKIIGLLKPAKIGSGVEFYLIDQSFGNNIVSAYKEKDQIAKKAIISQIENCVKLKDILNVVDNKEEADVILEPNELTKDSILKLFV